jgi:hypothetical protein
VKVAEFEYLDEGGAVAFVVERYEFKKPDGSFVLKEDGKRDKKFSRRRPDPMGKESWIWNVDGAPVVPYRLPQLIAAVAEKNTILIVEGESKADLLSSWNVPATCCAGGAEKWCAEHSKFLRGADVVILPDNDGPGRLHLDSVGKLLRSVANSIRVLDLPNLPPKGDIIDWAKQGGTVEQLRELIAREAKPWTQQESAGASFSEGFDSFDSSRGGHFSGWPEPKPLPKGLPPVAPFDPDFLPDAISPWVMDITNRMQCQADYVAVAAMTGLGAVIGRRVGIKPQMNTDWVEVPNIWGASIGRPGLMKSGAQHAGVGPLHHLEAEAAKKNAAALQAYQAELDDYKIRREVNRQFKKEALKGETKQLLELGAEPMSPVDIRYHTNDTSYESLGELLVGNPYGLLVERDELISLLQYLERDDQATARGFYLSGWSGQNPYTFDRIIRGHRHIEAVCISVLGNTQPARISEYVRRANAGGAGGDGLIQRFGLLAWPDVPPEWKNVDVPPDGVARQRAWSIFERISKMDASEAHRLGATQDKFDKIPAFRFTDAAHVQFLEWREEHERRLRSGELSPALEGHLSKYRKLVPGLALINHLADGKEGNVDLREVLKAIAYAEYLETHARRVYSSASESETAAAQAILKHIRKGDLTDRFTAREVHRPRWSNLTEHEQVASGLSLLVDFDYLAETELAPKPRGGRPKVVYSINPKFRA